LPTGLDPHAKFNDASKLRYNHSRSIAEGITMAYDHTARYLENSHT